MASCFYGEVALASHATRTHEDTLLRKAAKKYYNYETVVRTQHRYPHAPENSAVKPHSGTLHSRLALSRQQEACMSFRASFAAGKRRLMQGADVLACRSLATNPEVPVASGQVYPEQQLEHWDRLG